jgi:uroporphyrinogen-III decarboxylase
MTESHTLLLKLAAEGHRAPIGTHLVLHQHEDHKEIVNNGIRLGDVIVETAERFSTPLALPLMDLTLEKEALLTAIGVPSHEVEQFHFTDQPPAEVAFVPTSRMDSVCDAISHVAASSSLLPMGMGIGPFSLMTKLLSDPITPVFLAGSGIGPDEDPEVAMVERAISIGTELILNYITAQIDAGAKAFILCEPAANLVYFSPNQLAENYEVFDRFVTTPLRRIKALLDSRGVGLVFHDCGELTPGMVRRFAEIEPAMVSLGGSRLLWEDAALFSPNTVLYGNLPTKKFISAQLTVDEVERLSEELLAKMSAIGRPFILGSECDILSVPGHEDEILKKVDRFLNL